MPSSSSIEFFSGEEGNPGPFSLHYSLFGFHTERIFYHELSKNVYYSFTSINKIFKSVNVYPKHNHKWSSQL